MTRYLKPYLVIYFILIISILGNNTYAAVEQSGTTSSTMLDTPHPEDFGQQNNFIYRRHLSLIDCFNKADNNNKEIALAASNLPIAQAGMVIAKAIPNPTYNMAYGFGPAWKYVIAGNNQQIGWNEEIQIAGKRTKKMNVAHANYLQTAFEVEAVRFDVHNRIRRAYAELVMATAFAQLTQTQENIFQKLLDIAQKRFNTGKIPGSEILQARLNVTQLDTQRNQAQGRLVADSAQLAFLLGESPRSEEVIIPEELSLNNLLAGKNRHSSFTRARIAPLGELLPIAWRKRNDLKAAIQQAYVNRKALTLAKAQRIPDPYVGFNYMFSTYAPFQTSYYTPQPNAHKVPYQPGYMVTAAEEVPIFNHYQGQVNQAKATWIQQLKQNEQLQSQIAADIVSAYEALIVSIANMRKFQYELLPAALKGSQLSHRSYELGKTDLTTTILAQQQYGQLASSYFDTAITYQNNWADLEKAVGVPLNL